MTDNAVQIENLTYFYPNRQTPSLSGINLTIKQGKFIVIMGRNGSGKTTLALCLNGIIPQLLEGRMLGKVMIEAKDVGKVRSQHLAGTVGLVFQDPESQIIGSTVAEDTAFGPRNLGLLPEEIEHRVHAELTKVQLTGYESRKTDELSGGEKQRVVLAGVLAMHPKVLVLDEPASELDPQGRASLYSALDILRRKGAYTIVVIEHSIEDVWNRADEVVVLQDGKIAWQGEPGLLFRNLSLLDSLGIRPLTVSGFFRPFVLKGWINPEEIPLTTEEAADLIRKIFTLGKASGNESQPSWLSCNPSPCIREVETAACQDYSREEGSHPGGTVVIRDLTHHYNSSTLSLDRINLTIGSGEFVALIGPNGAGKTTLTKHLNGLLKPIEGEVWVGGKNIRQYKTAELAGTVGYVFQNPDHQLFATTVEKELAFGLKNAGKSQQEIEKRVAEVLEQFGLEEYRRLHPLTLAKNLRQLLTLASAVVLKPDILVVDEPTKGLDWPGAKRVMAVIRSLHEGGTTIIIITHDMELAVQAQRVVVLKEGRIFSDGRPVETFSDSERLSGARIIPPQIIRLAQIWRNRCQDGLEESERRKTD